jgi:enamine deaminase RidA (YjgF/YER057c/UK114 family)
MKAGVFEPTGAPKAIGPYSQAIASASCFLSGQVALDPATGQMVDGDVSVQTRRVMRQSRPPCSTAPG